MSRPGAARLLAWVLLLPGAVHAQTETAQFLFSWNAVPVGRVTLRFQTSPRAFVYRAEHFFTQAAAQTQARFERELALDARDELLDGGGVPEALWLWRRPAAGAACQPGVEERTGKRGPLCVVSVEGDVVRGSVLGEAFVATYRGARLESLVLGASRFEAWKPSDALTRVGDPFAAGIPVHGASGPLRLRPARAWPDAASAWACPGCTVVSEARARRLAQAASASGARELANCVRRARDFVEAMRRERGDARMVYGLVLDGDHAFPHAWVRVAVASGPLDLDPTLGGEVTPEDHLPLAARKDLEASEEAGRLYRDLYLGRRTVARGAGGSGR